MATLSFFFVSRGVVRVSVLAERVQVIPSAFAFCMGATAFWIAVSFLFGRIYCSTVCPVGTLSDLTMRLGPRYRRRTFRYKPASNVRRELFIGYLVCLVFGLTAVPFLLEPWNVMRNIVSATGVSATSATWATLGVGGGFGACAGVVSFVAIMVWSYFCGRDFCNTVCPLGTAMGLVSEVSLYHLEIDPDKCVGCMKCEEICRASAIKVAGRLVDNSRCVRCLDCLDLCDHEAIRFQINRNRPASPLMRRRRVRN